VPPNITGNAQLCERSRSLRESRAQKRRAVHLCNFIRDLLAGAEVLLFAEEIPEYNVAPDVHTVMIVSVFARTKSLSRCRWYTTPRAEFSRLPCAATLYQPLNRLQPSYLCKRRLPVHGLTDSAARLFSLLMMSSRERERERKRERGGRETIFRAICIYQRIRGIAEITVDSCFLNCLP